MLLLLFTLKSSGDGGGAPAGAGRNPAGDGGGAPAGAGQSPPGYGAAPHYLFRNKLFHFVEEGSEEGKGIVNHLSVGHIDTGAFEQVYRSL